MAGIYKIQLTPDTPDQVFSVALGANPYRVRVTWNERFGYWSLSIMEADETPIVMGLKMVENSLLLARVEDDRLPLGDLILARESGEPGRPSFNDLGVSVGLYYVEPDAVAPSRAVKTITAATITPLGSLWDSGLSEWDSGESDWDM